jgi:hypothetical protein
MSAFGTKRRDFYRGHANRPRSVSSLRLLLGPDHLGRERPGARWLAGWRRPRYCCLLTAAQRGCTLMRPRTARPFLG